MALKRINKKAVEDIVTFAWQVSQSSVIGLTGVEIFITSLGFQTVGLCLAVMFLAVQIVATLMIGSGFHWKEKLFIPLAWIPKATAQRLFALTNHSFISIIIMGDLLDSEISQPFTESRKAMQSIVKTAEKMIGSSRPSVRDMAYKWYHQRC